MFEAHFGFTATPFRKDLPAMALYSARLHAQVLQQMDYALAQCQIVVLCGETGSGKSTLLRALVAQQSPARYRFLVLAHPPAAPRDLYLDLLNVLGESAPWSTAEARTRTRQRLAALAEAGRTPVLVVDEAQDVPVPVLEQLRLLTAFELDGRPVLALVLAGHPELARHVRQKSLLALSERVGLWLQLLGLDRDEPPRYLQHHLELAGCVRPLFTPEATIAIFQATKGIPRAINRLATRCLQLAATLGRDQVVAELAEAVAAELN